ncbi:neutral/alkaline non-lysosomal ceramidase N-terminal domain-containing protein [Candidatus Hodarchaeum mangrovi]
MLLIGTHAVDITPKIGDMMGGYWYYDKRVEGVRDPIFATVLIMEIPDLICSVIMLDEWIIDNQLANEIKRAIEKRTGIQTENIAIGTNHPHCSPTTIPDASPNEFPMVVMPGDDPDALRQETKPRRERLVTLISAASEIANQNMIPCKVGFGKDIIEGIALNRNDPINGPIDKELSVVRFKPENGSAPILMTNFNVHPTVGPPATKLVSGDLVGASKALVKQIMGNNIQIIYTSGALGDVSTRFTRKENSFAEVDRLGRILGLEIVKSAELLTKFTEMDINFINSEMELHINQITDLHIEKQKLEEANKLLENARNSNLESAYVKKLEDNAKGALFRTRIAALSKKEQMIFANQTAKVPLQALRIGNIKFLFAPFEIYSAIALNVKKYSNDPNVIIVGHTNGYLSYIPTDYGFREKNYESFIATGVRGSDKVLENAFLDLLSKV